MEGSCKICNNDKVHKNLGSHIFTAHGGMKMDEYNRRKDEVLELEEIVPNQPIKPIDQLNNIFDGRVKETHEDQPLKVFLDEFGLTEKELRSIVTNYKEGKPLPIEHQNKINAQRGFKEAKEKQKQSVVITTNLYAAESLVKDFGFECVGVKSASPTSPKVWELKKIKQTDGNT